MLGGSKKTKKLGNSSAWLPKDYRSENKGDSAEEKEVYFYKYREY